MASSAVRWSGAGLPESLGYSPREIVPAGWDLGAPIVHKDVSTRVDARRATRLVLEALLRADEEGTVDLSTVSKILVHRSGEKVSAYWHESAGCRMARAAEDRRTADRRGLPPLPGAPWVWGPESEPPPAPPLPREAPAGPVVRSPGEGCGEGAGVAPASELGAPCEVSRPLGAPIPLNLQQVEALLARGVDVVDLGLPAGARLGSYEGHETRVPVRSGGVFLGYARCSWDEAKRSFVVTAFYKVGDEPGQVDATYGKTAGVRA